MDDDKKSDLKREVGERVDILCSLDSTTVKDLGEGVFETTITTSEVDRHGENIVTEGIDTQNWSNKNPVVLYGHDYSGLPIGKGLSLRTFKNKMTSRFQLAVKEYPFAKTVADLIKGGYLNAVSIGGVVKQWSDDYRTIEQMEMVEFSIVPVPANAGAIITQRSFEEATGKNFDDVRIEFEQFAQKSMVDKLKNMGEDDISKAIGILKQLVATLEDAAQPTSSVGDDAQLETVKQIKRIRIKDNAKSVIKEAERVIRIVKLKQ